MTQGYLSGPVIKRTLIKGDRGRLVTRGGGHVTTSAGGMMSTQARNSYQKGRGREAALCRHPGGNRI